MRKGSSRFSFANEAVNNAKILISEQDLAAEDAAQTEYFQNQVATLFSEANEQFLNGFYEKSLRTIDRILNLDPRNAELVMDALTRINREDGITVVVNLHHLDTARTRCDRIIGMAAGRIVFDDVPARLTDAAVHAVYGTADADEIAAIEEEATAAHRPIGAARPAYANA